MPRHLKFDIKYFRDGKPRIITRTSDIPSADVGLETNRKGNVIVLAKSNGTQKSYVFREYTPENLTLKVSFYADRNRTRKIMVPDSAKKLNDELHSEEFEYYTKGRRLRKSVIKRDTRGNIKCKISTTYITLNNLDVGEINHVETPTRNFYRHVAYDKYHRETSVKYSHDAEGKKLCFADNGFAKKAVEYDGKSMRIKRQITYDCDEKKINDPKTGYATEEREYDSYGNLSMRIFKYADDSPGKMFPLGVYAVRQENQPKFAGKPLKITFLSDDRKTPMGASDGTFGCRFEYETVNGVERMKCIYKLTEKAHVYNNGFGLCERVLYNASGKQYGAFVFSSSFQYQRVKNYLRVVQVEQKSQAAQSGILPDDIIIAAPGFDERNDCDLSFDEKMALIQKSAKNKREIISARIGGSGGVAVQKYEIPAGLAGMRLEPVMLNDAVFYDRIKYTTRK